MAQTTVQTMAEVRGSGLESLQTSARQLNARRNKNRIVTTKVYQDIRQHSLYSPPPCPGISNANLGVFASDCYAKQWEPGFSKDQGKIEDQRFVDIMRSLEAKGDDLRNFLRGYSEGPVPCCK